MMHGQLAIYEVSIAFRVGFTTRFFMWSRAFGVDIAIGFASTEFVPLPNF